MGTSDRIFVLGNHVQACCLSVPRVPRAGETLEATALQVEPGGKGLNVAIGLQRLGLSVSALFAVGRDAAGQALAQRLAAESLDRAICLPLSEQSGFGVGLIGADGQNSIAVYLGANALLTASHVREHAAQAICGADCVYCPFELSMEAVQEALRLGRQAGAFNVVNPSPYVGMDGAFWALCDGIVANETEAQALLGLDTRPDGQGQPLVSAAQWLDLFRQSPECSLAGQPWGGQWLVVTLGAQGAVMWRRGEPPLWAAAAQVQAVDTVGCGDAFACGFLSVWVRTRDAALALQAGNACGAHMATSRGVLDALPRRIPAPPSPPFPAHSPAPADPP